MISVGLNSEYKVGIYIRLSREDEDKENKNYESESIKNQKSLLLQYVKENHYRLIDIYVDDGYSGTNFDRPSFKRMVNDINLGRINMVITKDMSRLGRDYIGTGELIEKFFPEHGVRYIAVTDNIDTFLDNSNNDIAPFKAIMNDMYAKDISKKIKSSIKAKQKEGKFVSGRTPFGYDKDPKDKNHLVINEEQATTVKKIFELSKKGMTYYQIAKYLTNNNFKSPAQYYSFEWKQNYHLNYGIWNSRSVKDILKNEVYIGDLVQNKRNKINYKVKKVIPNTPDKYIIVHNTHEPIIDKELFYKIQVMLPKNKGRNEKKEHHLLDGLLYCGDCGHRISVQSRRKIDNNCYTICNFYRTYMKSKGCTVHCNNYDKLEAEILKVLKTECKKLIDKQKIKNQIDVNNICGDNTSIIKNKIKLLSEKINKYVVNIDDMYIDKLNGTIDNDSYVRIKDRLNNEIDKAQNEISDLQKELDGTFINEKISNNINKYIEEYLNLKKPNRDLIINLIEKIDIYEDKTIDIKFTFKSVN